MHGAVSIEELRDVGTPPPSTAVYILSSFWAATGSFHGQIWISAGDAQAAPVSFSSAASHITVALLDDEGKSAAMLTPGAPQTFGARQWVQYTTSGTMALPKGGWMSIELDNQHWTLQMAAPEVTTDALGPPTTTTTSSAPMLRRPLTDGERQAISLARQHLRDHKPPRHITTLPAK